MKIFWKWDQENIIFYIKNMKNVNFPYGKRKEKHYINLPASCLFSFTMFKSNPRPIFLCTFCRFCCCSCDSPKWLKLIERKMNKENTQTGWHFLSVWFQNQNKIHLFRLKLEWRSKFQFLLIPVTRRQQKTFLGEKAEDNK